MQRYKDLNGDSGILTYKVAANSITIKFKDGAVYVYDYASTGKTKVENMKELAKRGYGLTTYINVNIRGNYARKIA